MAQHNQIVKVIELGVAHIQMDHRNAQLALAALAQESARGRVASAAPVALTDSSGGAPTTVLVAVTTPAIGVVDGATPFAPKAGFDTVIGLIEDGHEELAAKLNELIALIAGSFYPTVEPMAGAAADNIIAAIATALTGSTGNDVVEAASGIAQINVARNNGAALAGVTNWCRVALGLAPYADGSGGMFTKPVAGDWPTTDAAATGVAASTAENTLVEVDVEAAFGAMIDNIASIAASCNEMRGALAGVFVVATQNPHTKFSVTNFTP